MDQTVPTTENTAPKSHVQKIEIVQVTTDVQLVQDSQQLENALQMGKLVEYCNYKIETSQDTGDKEIWKFILVK
jgi:hypothetical protein